MPFGPSLSGAAQAGIACFVLALIRGDEADEAAEFAAKRGDQEALPALHGGHDQGGAFVGGHGHAFGDGRVAHGLGLAYGVSRLEKKYGRGDTR